MRRKIGEGGENRILFILSPSISKEGDSERKEDYLHNPFENILTGKPT
jgi:hypothetical protein